MERRILKRSSDSTKGAWLPVDDLPRQRRTTQARDTPRYPWMHAIIKASKIEYNSKYADAGEEMRIGAAKRRRWSRKRAKSVSATLRQSDNSWMIYREYILRIKRIRDVLWEFNIQYVYDFLWNNYIFGEKILLELIIVYLLCYDKV